MDETPNTIINDLFLGDEYRSSRVVDTLEFFPRIETRVVYHNATKLFTDMRSGVAPDIDLTEKPILRINALRKTRHLGDLYNPRDFNPTFLSILSKDRIFRPNPIIAIDPLPETRPNSLDIRTLEELVSRRTYPDLYYLPTPISRKIKRYIRKHRKQLAMGGVVVASLSVSLLLLGISAKGYIEQSTITQYNRLSNLKSIGNISDFQKEVSDIRGNFGTISLLFSPFRILLDNNLISNDTVHLAGNVISGGLSLSEALEQSTQLGMGIIWGVAKDGDGITFEAIEKSNIKVTDYLRTHRKALEGIDQELGTALTYYAGIESLGNSALNDKFQKNVASLLGIKQVLSFSLAHFDDVLSLLGDNKPERYMILNQNRDELRANGGFPGSILSFELYKGRLQKFEKHDVYDYDWKLYPYKEKPPAGLEWYSDNYGIRDANYYPDFRDSMKKIGFFVEKAGFSSVDTMIAINQGIIIDLLKKYGPVRLSEYNLTVTADNFSLVMSTLVEARVFPYKKLDTAHTYQSPKEFLFRFMDTFGKQLLDKRDFFGYLTILSEHFRNHEILIASNNTETDAFIEQFGTRESWQTDQGNWIYPIFTSLSANKSDRYMQRTLSVKTESISGCTVHNTVKLTSDHAITIDETIKTRKLLYDFSITDIKEQERLLFIEGNGPNKQYIRFLVPRDSVLDPGTSLKTESGRDNYTIFSARQDTDPMKQSTLNFGYTSKISNCTTGLNSYKQPGLVNMEVIKQ